MLLELRGVRHDYDGRRVLHDVDLELDFGEVAAIMGPSGSGKSTLLSIAGRALLPSAGEVRFHQTSSVTGRRGGVAWIFQNNPVLPGRTATDNVAIARLINGEDRRSARIAARAALQQLGLAGVADHQIETLSGGERQRVCVGRALAAGPLLLLADEPTANLDRSTASLVIDTILDRAIARPAVLVATHDPDVAARCGRVLRLTDGALSSDG